MQADRDESMLYVAIAAGLEPARASVQREAALRLAVFERVRRSALAHRDYLTVRREDGALQRGADGTTSRILRADAGMRVAIVRLAPGVPLPWPQDATARELLVLDGSLASNDRAPVTTGGHAYSVRLRVEPGASLHSVGDTTVYVRHCLVEPSSLPALEARWWSLATRPAAWIDPGCKRWRQVSEGVEVLPLRGDSEVVSMLVRFAPGASVADHHHALDEDCLVLDGEMFLGDILLRAGDYQLAPAGGSHFGETSDVGVLFFFHGALDPVLRGERAAS
jgi:quercetin dioxygenase-like cupin family protein